MRALKGKRVGLIGVGNMGSAIFEGVLNENIVDHTEMGVFDVLADKKTNFASKWNVVEFSSVAELVEWAHIIFLAIKPQDFQKTAEEIKPAVGKGKVLISILAGVDLGRMRSAFGDQVSVVRAMPNLGARVAASMTALASNDPDALKAAQALFEGCGKTVALDEKHFDLFTAICGSGPAYFFYLMEQMVEEAVAKGLPKDKARAIAVQTALGSALLAEQASESPAELKQMVTSKGGTTEAALNVLNENRVAELMREAFNAARIRGEELRKI